MYMDNKLEDRATTINMEKWDEDFLKIEYFLYVQFVEAISASKNKHDIDLVKFKKDVCNILEECKRRNIHKIKHLDNHLFDLIFERRFYDRQKFNYNTNFIPELNNIELLVEHNILWNELIHSEISFNYNKNSSRENIIGLRNIFNNRTVECLKKGLFNAKKVKEFTKIDKIIHKFCA